MRQFIKSALAVLLVFSIPLYQVIHFSFQSGLYSYIALVPAVSLWLAWQRRHHFDQSGNANHPNLAWIFLVPGLGFLIWYGLRLLSPGGELSAQTSLALAMYAMVFLLAGFACRFLNLKTVGVLAFPLIFLLFLAPFPRFVEIGLEHFLQRGSAIVAHGFFKIAGTPVLRDGTYFRLPGFSMEVAPECSGINSTVALLLTSLVAGQLLLRSPRKRATLALLVLPIALVRNGLRVVTIGELCVHIGPEMIDSYIHHHGGPIFFALSLVPFSLLLFYLLKSERLTPSIKKSVT